MCMCVCVCVWGALNSYHFQNLRILPHKTKSNEGFDISTVNEFSILYLHLVKSDTLLFSHGID